MTIGKILVLYVLHLSQVTLVYDKLSGYGYYYNCCCCYHYYYCTCSFFLTGIRPDITALVDWV